MGERCDATTGRRRNLIRCAQTAHQPIHLLFKSHHLALGERQALFHRLDNKYKIGFHCLSSHDLNAKLKKFEQCHRSWIVSVLVGTNSNYVRDDASRTASCSRPANSWRRNRHPFSQCVRDAFRKFLGVERTGSSSNKADSSIVCRESLDVQSFLLCVLERRGVGQESRKEVLNLPRECDAIQRSATQCERHYFNATVR